MKEILVVHKISKYQQYVMDGQDEHLDALVSEGDISVAQWKASHDRHVQSLEQIVAELGKREHVLIDVKARHETFYPDRYDLIISVGGDGTVLDLSHQVSWTPVLGINSDPERSVGYFCAGDASDVSHLLDQTLEKAWQPMKLNRFFVTIDGHRTPPVLNDILISHANPGAVSSYIIRIAGHEEAQRSSGVWISTSAGSTAAIRSAGGFVMPLESQNVQFVVREPYMTSRTRYRQLRGIRASGTPIEFISRMTHGRVYLDGPYKEFRFETGSRLSIDYSAPPLLIYGLDPKRRTE